MILSKLQNYATAIAGVALTVLLLAVKILSSQNSKLRVRVESAKANNAHAREVLTKDISIGEQTDSHRAELIDELENTGNSSDFRDPSGLWDSSDD